MVRAGWDHSFIEVSYKKSWTLPTNHPQVVRKRGATRREREQEGEREMEMSLCTQITR